MRTPEIRYLVFSIYLCKKLPKMTVKTLRCEFQVTAKTLYETRSLFPKEIWKNGCVDEMRIEARKLLHDVDFFINSNEYSLSEVEFLFSNEGKKIMREKAKEVGVKLRNSNILLAAIFLLKSNSVGMVTEVSKANFKSLMGGITDARLNSHLKLFRSIGFIKAVNKGGSCKKYFGKYRSSYLINKLFFIEISNKIYNLYESSDILGQLEKSILELKRNSLIYQNYRRLESEGRVLVHQKKEKLKKLSNEFTISISSNRDELNSFYFATIHFIEKKLPDLLKDNWDNSDLDSNLIDEKCLMANLFSDVYLSNEPDIDKKDEENRLFYQFLQMEMKYICKNILNHIFYCYPNLERKVPDEISVIFHDFICRSYVTSLAIRLDEELKYIHIHELDTKSRGKIECEFHYQD